MAGGHIVSSWERPGKAGSDPISPGSYGGYRKVRKAPKAYSTTEQQRRVAEAGRKVGATCKGKKGGEFRRCRADVMKSIFG